MIYVPKDMSSRQIHCSPAVVIIDSVEDAIYDRLQIDNCILYKIKSKGKVKFMQNASVGLLNLLSSFSQNKFGVHLKILRFIR